MFLKELMESGCNGEEAARIGKMLAICLDSCAAGFTICVIGYKLNSFLNYCSRQREYQIWREKKRNLSTGKGDFHP